jgi:hypothetical protein
MWHGSIKKQHWTHTNVNFPDIVRTSNLGLHTVSHTHPASALPIWDRTSDFLDSERRVVAPSQHFSEAEVDLGIMSHHVTPNRPSHRPFPYSCLKSPLLDEQQATTIPSA